MSIDELIDPSSAAEQLGLKYGQVIRAIRAGKLKAEKIGWNWVINQKEVDRYKGVLTNDKQGS